MSDKRPTNTKTYGMTPGARRALRRHMALMVVLIVAVGLVIWRSTGESDRIRHYFDGRLQQQSRQQQATTAKLVSAFCDFIAPQADPQPPPTTERGRRAQRAAAELSVLLRCPPGGNR